MESIWPDEYLNCIPTWWHDMHQALESAFRQFRRFINALEKTLDDIPYRDHNGVLPHLVRGLEHSGEHLSRILNLAETRLNDAKAAEQREMVLETCRAVALSEFARCGRTKEKLLMKMGVLQNELSHKTSFRDVTHGFRVPAPAYVDLQL